MHARERRHECYPVVEQGASVVCFQFSNEPTFSIFLLNLYVTSDFRLSSSLISFNKHKRDKKGRKNNTFLLVLKYKTSFEIQIIGINM